MSGLTDFQIPPPTMWQDFEDLCLDLWRSIWDDPDAQKNGRQGQPQHGVDVFGRPNRQGSWAGVQCKQKNGFVGSTLTEAELLEEVRKAKSFVPRLTNFTIAYTGSRDAALQARARLLTELHLPQQLFTVHVWSWDDVLENLTRFPAVFARHYTQFDRVYRGSPNPNIGSEKSSLMVDTLEQQQILVEFKPPINAAAMIPRNALCSSLQQLLQNHSSVYLNAPSGYGKSVLMSQLNLPAFAWIDCADDIRDFDKFRSKVARFVRAKYLINMVHERPSDFARALDDAVGRSSDPFLVLAIDNADGIDTGVKTFVETVIGSATCVRLVLAASNLHLRRQAAMQVSRRLTVISARDLAFEKEETRNVVAAPLACSGPLPSPEFAEFVHEITGGWPIAVQLVRAKYEIEPNEDVVCGSLRDITTGQLEPYLLESYWNSLGDRFQRLLATSSLFVLFDRSDLEAITAGDFTEEWRRLTSLPFLSHLPQSLMAFQPLFWTFLRARLTELGGAEVRRLHRLASLHFLESKQVAPAALHHAQQSGDKGLTVRAAGAMAEFAFAGGLYGLMEEALGAVDVMDRWNDVTLAVHQGRFYENRKDYPNALKWYRRTQELSRETNAQYWQVGVVSDIGSVLRQMGKPEEAIALYEDALAQLAPDEPSRTRAQLLANRGNAFLQQDRLLQAEKDYQDAQAILILNRDDRGLAKIQLGLAQIAREQGRLIDAYRLSVRALRRCHRLRDLETFVRAAVSVSEELIQHHRLRAGHRLLKGAIRWVLSAEPVVELPFLLNNFGFCCAFLPEPDPNGIEALLLAIKIKESASMRFGGSLQNLTTLLIRLGRFDKALPLIRKQTEAAKQAGDVSLIDDAEQKFLELKRLRESGTLPEWIDHNPDQLSEKMRLGFRKMTIEGLVRAVLGKQPLLREFWVSDVNAHKHQISISNRSIELLKARCVLIASNNDFSLLARNPNASLPGPSNVRDENLVFQFVPVRNVSSKFDEVQPGIEISAIWFVRSANMIWVQAFSMVSDSGDLNILAFGGSCFSVDPSHGSWIAIKHPESCDCGRAEIHEQHLSVVFELLRRYEAGACIPLSVNNYEYSLVVC